MLNRYQQPHSFLRGLTCVAMLLFLIGSALACGGATSEQRVPPLCKDVVGSNGFKEGFSFRTRTLSESYRTRDAVAAEVLAANDVQAGTQSEKRSITVAELLSHARLGVVAQGGDYQICRRDDLRGTRRFKAMIEAACVDADSDWLMANFLKRYASTSPEFFSRQMHEADRLNCQEGVFDTQFERGFDAGTRVSKYQDSITATFAQHGISSADQQAEVLHNCVSTDENVMRCVASIDSLCPVRPAMYLLTDSSPSTPTDAAVEERFCQLLDRCVTGQF